MEQQQPASAASETTANLVDNTKSRENNEPAPRNGGGGDDEGLERQFADSLVERVFSEAMEIVAQRQLPKQQGENGLGFPKGAGAAAQVGELL